MVADIQESEQMNASRVKLYVPTEESFSIPLKYIDVTRTTYISLDVLLDKKIDD